MERVRYIHQKFECDVLIEEYIEGRELYLSVLGNRRLTVFPPREIFFEQVPDDVPKFATSHAKWNEKYRDKWGIKNGPAKELPAGVEEHLKQLARKVYRVLKIRRIRARGRAADSARRRVRDRGESQPVPGAGRGFRPGGAERRSGV